ncbi:MAG: DNA cytosine methyltransferase, partial [Myxococcota bacterium]
PIWDDVTTFDGRPWRGAVDLVTAGFPCQPWSSAGRRRGTDDDRWLWPEILRVVSEVRPALVFLENSPRLDVRGVRSTLRALGYRSKATRARAEDVGAPHRRERVFILAYANGPGWVERSQLPVAEQPDASGRGGPLADSASKRCESKRSGGLLDCVREALRHDADRRRGQALADANSPGLRQQPRRRGRPGRQETSFPPGPLDRDGWDHWDGPQPGVRRGAPGTAHRMDRLRALGNAVVPAQAEAALRELLK